MIQAYGSGPIVKPPEIPTAAPWVAPETSLRVDLDVSRARLGAPQRARVSLRREAGKTFMRIESAGRLLSEVVFEGDSVSIEVDL